MLLTDITDSMRQLNMLEPESKAHTNSQVTHRTLHTQMCRAQMMRKMHSTKTRVHLQYMYVVHFGSIAQRVGCKQLHKL